MASYRQLSRVARLVDGVLDLDLLTDEEVDTLLECADDEALLMETASELASGPLLGRDGVERSHEPSIGGEEPHLIGSLLHRGFRVLRGGKA